MKIKVWLDSGANHRSKYEVTVDVEDLGFSESEWRSLTEEQREAAAKDLAFEHSDWGYEEVI